jgi:putative FmdB family regulatory protein
MPIYDYCCNTCGSKKELYQKIGDNVPECCGVGMNKKPTYPALVKWKGEGGFPTMRRAYKGGTAPNTRGYDLVPQD